MTELWEEPRFDRWEVENAIDGFDQMVSNATDLGPDVITGLVAVVVAIVQVVLTSALPQTEKHALINRAAPLVTKVAAAATFVGVTVDPAFEEVLRFVRVLQGHEQATTANDNLAATMKRLADH